MALPRFNKFKNRVKVKIKGKRKTVQRSVRYKNMRTISYKLLLLLLDYNDKKRIYST